MNRAQFVLALWGVTGLAAGLQAGDCDAPESKCCQCRDDSGILDHVDKVAGQFHASFKKNFSLISKLGKSGPTGCDATPSCGCEAEPNCGCEIKPSCGCEIKPSCGCEVHSSNNSSPPITESYSQPPATMTQKRSIPSRESNPSSLSAPQPVPDTQVNPFADEVKSSQSKVRGRTIQYRTNSQQPLNPSQPQQMPTNRQRQTYGQQYNSQARASLPSNAGAGQSGTSQRPLQLVAPASAELPNYEQMFKSAHRVKISDMQDSTEPLQLVGNGLRAVPEAKKVEAINTASTSSRNNSRLIVPTEPIRDLNDPYERPDSDSSPAIENPLRR